MRALMPHGGKCTSVFASASGRLYPLRSGWFAHQHAIGATPRHRVASDQKMVCLSASKLLRPAPRRALGLATAAALLLATAAVAQELPGARVGAPRPPAAPPKPAAQTVPQAPTAAAPAQQAQTAPQVPTIVANADLVNMVFSVQDKHGAFVPGLDQQDFRVLEDGRLQTISFFSTENSLPLTLGLLLDTSPSQEKVLVEEQQISDQFFRQVITPKDLAFVIGFDVDTTLLQDLTASQQLLSSAVDRAHIGGGDPASIGINPGTFPTPGNGGATHLWDAIYLACHDMLAHQVGRKALIVVTDGGEQGSTYTDQDALHAALDSNTVVFAVIAADRNFAGYGGSIGPGPGQLRKIAEQTGGRSIDAGRKIGEAFDRIQQELRSQYSLGYRTDQPAHDGRFRAVKIELTDAAAHGDAKDAKVRARSGYFAPGPGH